MNQSTGLRENTTFGDGLFGPVFCEPFGLKVVSSGYFAGEDPTEFTLPILLLQLGTNTFLSAVLNLILKPLGLPKYICDILGGIILGPSVIGHSSFFHELFFSDKSLMVLDVYEQVAVIVFSFLVGLNTDVSVLLHSKRYSVTLGISSFLFPFMISTMTVSYGWDKSRHNIKKSTLYTVTILESMINYHVISVILTDLRLVNSELGRVALSSSMISTLCTLLIMMSRRSVNDTKKEVVSFTLAPTLCRGALLLCIVFLTRPIMFWMIKKTPEGKTMKEAYICALILLIFLVALISDVMGLNCMFAVMILGMVVPEGPPLASGLVEKLELFVNAILLPSLTLNLGRKVNFYLITAKTFMVVESLVLVAFFAKLVGSMLPSFYWKMPFKDAFFLGLLMNCQGLLDIQFYSYATTNELISEEILSIMVLMAISHTAGANLLLRHVYDPSIKLLGYKIRTIQEATASSRGELRILVCVHQEQNVTTLVNILEASNPTQESPISVSVLDLVDLAGRAMPLFITHKLERSTSSKSTRTERIISAFRQYQVRNQGLVSVQCFTSIAPYATIHEDICTLALERATTFVITSYNKSDMYTIRASNKNILEKAPCSVGILVERGLVKDTRVAEQSWFKMNVCTIFIGGPDDREALVYSMRMAAHPNIRLDVIRIMHVNYHETATDLIERKLDLNIIGLFKMNLAGNKRVSYQEECVTEGTGTTRVLQALKRADYDLIVVGRRHDKESPVMLRLAEWSETPELGIVGDILTSSEFRCNAAVLVVQQYDTFLENTFSARNMLPAETAHSNLRAGGVVMDVENCNANATSHQLLVPLN